MKLREANKGELFDAWLAGKADTDVVGRMTAQEAICDTCVLAVYLTEQTKKASSVGLDIAWQGDEFFPSQMVRLHRDLRTVLRVFDGLPGREITAGQLREALQ